MTLKALFYQNKNSYILITVIFFIFLFYFQNICFSESRNLLLQVDRNKIQLGGNAVLSIQAENTRDLPAPNNLKLDAFNISYLGVSSNISIIKNQISSKVTHRYILTALKLGTFKIGPVEIEHNGIIYKSNELEIEVVKHPGNRAVPKKKEPVKQNIKNKGVFSI